MFDLFVAAAEKAANAAANTAANAAAGTAEGANAVAQQSGGNPPPQQPSPLMSMLPFILIFVVMIFFMNRSQKKQMAKRQEMMDKITKGTTVLLNSGIYGKVVEVKEDAFMVEIAENVKIKVNKSGVASVDEPVAGKSEAK